MAIPELGDERVIVVGAGIAGPILALLLHKKGYRPVIVEKVTKLGEAGGSIYLQPNGLKVLGIVGLADQVLKGAVPCQEMRDITSTGEMLGKSTLPSTYVQRYGYPATGVWRTQLNSTLRDALLSCGIAIHQGWKLEDIRETETGVTAISTDGRRLEGSFLVGCDGLKAISRSVLLRRKGITQENVDFTGLTQRGGRTPTPASLCDSPGMDNFYGPGAHVITYPLPGGYSSWAITSPDSQAAEESWSGYSTSELPTQKTALLQEFASWCTPVRDLIQGAERLMKYGLYDRRELTSDQWYSGRSVLIGDAAHPTSPHLGQGANQAMEDCFHLSRLLPDVNEARPLPISTQDLTAVFRTFAEMRQPRTAALVKGARAQGERRVVIGGPKACEERDEILRAQWKDETALETKLDALLREPFE